MEPQAQSPDCPERRRTSRRPLKAHVDFRRCKETRYRIPLGDLSPHGCRISPTRQLSAGERVWVALPGLQPVPARVRWFNDWDAGAVFDQPMHPAVFDFTVNRLQPSTSA